jgi:phage gp16-like protein
MSSIRRALLAKIHIAIKDMGIDDELYRLILQEEFGAKSAAELGNRQLEQLVERFERKGWKPRRQSADDGRQQKTGQADALKEKVGQILLHSDFDEVRLRGLVRKICGVDHLEWCGDAVRLKKLLAVIGRMMDRGDIKVIRGQMSEVGDQG